MNAAQIAHFLKDIGRGSEMAGIVTVYKSGIVVGVGSTILIGAAGYGIIRLTRWGIGKCHEYQQKRLGEYEVMFSQ